MSLLGSRKSLAPALPEEQRWHCLAAAAAILSGLAGKLSPLAAGQPAVVQPSLPHTGSLHAMDGVAWQRWSLVGSGMLEASFTSSCTIVSHTFVHALSLSCKLGSLTLQRSCFV
jgi:hypothetical protein